MKKIVVLIMAFFLVFSTNVFSQGKPHKNVQSAKTEQSKKGSTKTKRTPRKSSSKKKVHKPTARHQATKKSGRGVKV